MILSSKNQEEFCISLDKIGFGNRIQKDKSVLIKINMARPAEKNHPRTDARIVRDVIYYIYSNGGTCALAESANGYLRKNLELTGLSDVIISHNVSIIDLDLEETEGVAVTGEEHYLPKCLKDYDLRIAIPASSKRPGMVFSNNVKLFVGAVPRRMYQVGDKVVDWRPRVHIDLHKSVADIFTSIQSYSPFHFYINGGLAMAENRGEFQLEERLVGTDGVELDLYILKNYFQGFEVPEYLKRVGYD